MNLVPWKHSILENAFGGLFDFDKELNRLFDGSLKLKSVWGPAVDIYHDENAIRIKADLPGLEEDEIEVSVSDGILTIKGDRKQEKEKKEKGYYRSECVYGSFERSFSLPSHVDSEKVIADYKNGVLEITLPKKVEVSQKKIRINKDR